MRIGFNGKLEDRREIRAGFIGCGSHSFRNIYPTFQFAPVKLAATCDLELDKARAFADKFGAGAAYDDYHEMLAKERLDAVFVVTGYDSRLRPLYPKIAVDCLNQGCHVFIEKPPAATCGEIDAMRQASEASGKNVVVGFKKMFFPANEKANELASDPDFGSVSMALLQYPQYVPTTDEFFKYMAFEPVGSVAGFLDHLCHPVSLLVFLLGMPSTLYYERSANGGGAALFTFPSGAVASLALTCRSSMNGGMERTTIVSDAGRHIVVDNNVRLGYHKSPPGLGYGVDPSYYNGGPGDASTVWEPEFSLGQLYNKGLFLLGYYNEVNEFAMSILENRKPVKGTLDDAWKVTRIFEKFTEGPGKVIPL